MRDNGKTMREAFLEERYKEFGISCADVEEVINKDTMYEGLEGFKLDEKLAKVGQALKDKDAESLVNELGGNNNATRTKTWQKSFNVGAFSDLIGSASKNRLLGHNGERGGYFGHDDAYYRDGGANTEVFANVTALKATNEPFWDKVLEVFMPNTNKAYDTLIDISNGVKWENDKQSLFRRIDKE